MSEGLNPCPVCGSESIGYRYYYAFGAYRYRFVCNSCGVAGMPAKTRQRAVYYWNNWGASQ